MKKQKFNRQEYARQVLIDYKNGINPNSLVDGLSDEEVIQAIVTCKVSKFQDVSLSHSV